MRERFAEAVKIAPPVKTARAARSPVAIFKYVPLKIAPSSNPLPVLAGSDFQTAPLRGFENRQPLAYEQEPEAMTESATSTTRRAVTEYAERDGHRDHNGDWRAPCQVCAELKPLRSLHAVPRPCAVLGTEPVIVACSRCAREYR